MILKLTDTESINLKLNLRLNGLFDFEKIITDLYTMA